MRTIPVASVWLRGIVQLCQLRCDDSIDSKGGDRETRLKLRVVSVLTARVVNFPPHFGVWEPDWGSYSSDSYKWGW